MAVTFDAGEPLDIDKLKQLSDALMQLNKDLGNLKSSTTGKIAKSWSGSVNVTKAIGSANGKGEAEISFADAGFSAKPKIVATANTPYITVGIKPKSTDLSKAVVEFTASTKTGYTNANFWINFVAVAIENGSTTTA